jgi:hypothetical protein
MFARLPSQLSIRESIPDRPSSAEITSAAANSPFWAVVSAPMSFLNSFFIAQQLYNQPPKRKIRKFLLQIKI